MSNFIQTLLSSDHFMPHGHCFLWNPGILWLNVGSDAVVAFSYFAIPFALIYFVRKRRDLTFNWIFVMFAMFIVACGTTHLIEILTVWRPFYGIQGLAKCITAGISLTTAIALWPLMPRAIAIPSTRDLDQKNKELLALTEQLRQTNKSRLHQIIEAAPNGLMMVNQDGKIVLCNAEVESLFQYRRDELLGQTIEILVPEKFRQIHPHHRAGYFVSPETRQMGAGRDLMGLRKDGTEIPVEIGLSPVQTDEGQFVLASIVDITERKLIEQKLYDAITARDQFMSIASHELKTPLTSLGLQIQMAKKAISADPNTILPPETFAKILELSDKQVHRLSGLVTDLMDVTRIQSGKFSFNFERVNLSEIVREMIDRFSAEFAKAKIECTTDIEDTIIGTFDPVRMEQVIDNLLSNAIKYAPNHPIRVSLRRLGSNAKFIVEDQGPGIPTDKQARIFDRFERATTSKKISGLGLGLFIVREIVHGHLGSISLESSLGKGTQFIIHLPLDGKTISEQI